MLQKRNDVQERSCCIALHLLIAQHHEIGILAAQGNPAQHVIPPGAELLIKLPGDEARHKTRHRIIVRNISRFHIVVVEGNRHIPRITHDVDHMRIMWLK